MRWVLDILVLVVMATGSWVIGRMNHLEESGHVIEKRVSSLESSVLLLDTNVSKLVLSIDKLTDQQRSLILLSTFRTDPWSGAMMDRFQDEWYDLLKDVMPDLKHSEMPSIGKIQRDLASDLVPKGLTLESNE
jgi:hypothetical protein